MRTKEIELYTFAELDDCAKERAREWYRQGAFDYEWWDGAFTTFQTAAEMLGIEFDGTKARPAIYFSGFWSQGDGASFEGSYSYAKGALAAVKREFPQDKELHEIAAALQDAQRPYFYRLEATIKTRGRYHSLDVDVFDREDNCRDVEERPVREALNDFTHWIYRTLESEFEWLNSDEQVDESIEANGYEFDVDGNWA